MKLDFCEVFDDYTSRCRKIPKEEYLSNGKYIVIDQGKNSIAGYTNVDDGLFEDVPAIVFGDHTRIIKYVNEPFFLGADGVKLLKSKIKDANYKYLYYALRNARIPDTGYNRHFKWLKEISLEYKDAESQKNIVKILDTVTNIIELCKAELSELDNLIKARFVELFGDPLNNTKGWMEQRLGECCVINPKKTTDSRLEEDFEISFIPMASVSECGEILKLEDKFYREVKNGFTYFCEGDVLFAKITPCMENGKGAVAVGLTNGIGFGSTEFHVLRPIKEKSNSYWLYALTSFELFRKKAEKNMTGSAGQKRVPASFLENIKISVPPISLQDEFEKLLIEVNKSKVEVKKALDEAQLLFDSLMQKYFG